MTNIAPRQDRVDILLATFNGQRFIQRQVESVLEQMDSGCRLLIRDDGSTDGTVSLVQSLFAQQGGCFAGGRLFGVGFLPGFGLLEYADADYVVLCDQDDVWLPGRLALPIERIKTIERQRGTHTPVLAHTDLVVADEDLRTVAPSFWSYSNLRPQRGQELNRLLVQNVVTGCATTDQPGLGGVGFSDPGGVGADARLVAGAGRLRFRRNRGHSAGHGLLPATWEQLPGRDALRLAICDSPRRAGRPRRRGAAATACLDRAGPHVRGAAMPVVWTSGTRRCCGIFLRWRTAASFAGGACC